LADIKKARHIETAIDHPRPRLNARLGNQVGIESTTASPYRRWRASQLDQRFFATPVDLGPIFVERAHLG